MQGDPGQHFIGWHAFRNEPWSVPPGRIANLLHPFGTTIGYTDSLPLFAFALKAISLLLPPIFQYTGLWLIACFCLQGFFASALIRMTTPSILPRLLGSAFFVTAPILLFRFRHDTLCAHWLILAAFCCYFSGKKCSTSWIVLFILSALIHPYLLIMVAAVYAAHWLRAIINVEDSICRSLLFPCGVIAVIFALWWAIGYFQIERYTELAGHRTAYYSANLLAFINPMQWSALLPNVAVATAGQHEGYAYLGAGMMLLLALCTAACVVYRSKLKNSNLILWPLISVALLLFIFSLSTKITFGANVLLDLNANHFNRLLAPFQSTGRFLWPLYYLSYLFPFVVGVRILGTRAFTMLAAACLLLQFYDLNPKHEMLRARFFNDKTYVDKLLRDPYWKQIPEEIKHLAFVPPSFCGPPPAPYLLFAYLAINNRLTFNDGYAARAPIKQLETYCQELATQYLHRKFAANTLYVVRKDHLQFFDSCFNADGYDVCTVRN